METNQNQGTSSNDQIQPSSTSNVAPGTAASKAQYNSVVNNTMGDFINGLVSDTKPDTMKGADEAGSTSVDSTAPEDSSRDDSPSDPLDNVSSAPTDIQTKPEEDSLDGEDAQASTESDEERVAKTKSDSIKDLRKMLNETKATSEATIAEIKAKLEKYESGELVPEPLKNLQEKAQQLSRLESLIDVKSMPDFEEKWVQPIEASKQKLYRLGEDYGIPKETLDAYLDGSKSEKEKNEFLGRYFGAVGGVKAATLMEEVAEKTAELKALDNKPKAELDRIIQQNREMLQARRNEAKAVVANSAERAWTDALQDIYKEGVVTELIPKAGDDKFNNTWVAPLHQKASQEYGKLIKALVDEIGIEKLTPEIAKGLAKSTLYSIAAATAFESRNAALEHAKTIEEGTKRTASYIRPQIGFETAMPSRGQDTSSRNGNSFAEHMTPAQKAAAEIASNAMNQK